MTEKILSLVVGSVVGGSARYLLSGLVTPFEGDRFPWGTFWVNMLGCFFIGFLYYFSAQRFHLHQPSRLLLITGFCGAFTTFSTFMLEISHLTKSGNISLALGYAAASLVIGFALFETGVLVGQRF